MEEVVDVFSQVPFSPVQGLHVQPEPISEASQSNDPSQLVDLQLHVFCKKFINADRKTFYPIIFLFQEIIIFLHTKSSSYYPNYLPSLYLSNLLFSFLPLLF